MHTPDTSTGIENQTVAQRLYERTGIEIFYDGHSAVFSPADALAAFHRDQDARSERTAKGSETIELGPIHLKSPETEAAAMAPVAVSPRRIISLAKKKYDIS